MTNLHIFVSNVFSSYYLFLELSYDLQIIGYLAVCQHLHRM